MIITIDYNNDTITLDSDDEDEKPIIFSKVKGINMVKDILENVVNMVLPAERLELGIHMELIDEDVRTTIGDW